MESSYDTCTWLGFSNLFTFSLFTKEITRKKQLSYAHSKFTKTAQTQVQALFNKCRKNKINPELPSIVINNDDWDNVSMDVRRSVCVCRALDIKYLFSLKHRYSSRTT